MREAWVVEWLRGTGIEVTLKISKVVRKKKQEYEEKHTESYGDEHSVCLQSHSGM